MPPNTKPLMILGQDECIFKQYLFTKGVWVMPDGTRQLIPKEEGHGIMISSLCSRELGYGCLLSKEDLDAINEKRKNQHYSDKAAAIMLHGTSKKSILTCSPFVRELSYGAGHDGYWSYEHMVLQLEDCIDVLHHTHPQFDYLFLLDHSNGHDRLQEDGLSISKINIKFGGKQPRMRSSTLMSSHFGPYHNQHSSLQPGHIQSMIFQESDDGPFYLSDDERQSQQFDKITGEKKKKDMTKVELKAQLIQAGISDPRGSRKVLRDQCCKLDLPVDVEVSVVKEGWHGKPKGSLQILYERGWIDASRLSLYTSKGTKDKDIANGDVTGCAFSINCLMKLQSDFVNEITQLQFHVQKLGAFVDRSPKCHPELAGEGIEYAWALAKLRYRRSPASNKRNKENFILLVRKVTNPTTTLSIDRIRSCSKRARSYMKLYKSITEIEKGGEVMDKKHSILESAIKLYLKLKKVSKTHRSVVDLQMGDVMDIENSTVNNNKNNKSDNGMRVKEETIGLLVKTMNCM